MMKPIDYARSYIGTPFHHQGRLPGVGLDCAGVVVCALVASGVTVQDVKGYGRVPTGGIFAAAVGAQCDKIELSDAQVGDFIMFAFRDEPQHIAMISGIDPIMLIHAYQDVGRVVENALDDTWKARMRGVYRLKGGA